MIVLANRQRDMITSNTQPSNVYNFYNNNLLLFFFKSELRNV